MLLSTNAAVARDFRKELLPVALDNIANTNPELHFAWIARDPNAELGFWEVSYGDLANLVDRVAWWLEETLGKPDPDTFPTVTYIGVGDLRYYGLLLGCIKAGYKILLPSLANSVPMLERLMEEGKSEVFLYSSGSNVAETVRSKVHQRHVLMPELETFLEPGAKKYPYSKTPEGAATDPVCIFHTSGTTGFPKVRIMTHAHLASRISAAHPPSKTGRSGITRNDGSDKRRLLLGTVGYVSMLLGLIGPIWGGRTSVLAPLHLSVPDYTPEIFNCLARRGRVDSAFIFPKLAIDLAKNAESLQIMETLQHVSFGGGPLPAEVSTILSQRTQLNSCWSSSETGVFAFQEPDEDAAEYSVVDTEELNLHFASYAPDLYELQILRDRDREDPFGWHQAVFVMFPELETWHTGDLFSPHPSKAHHWLSRGRVDDMIVGSLGQSVNPGPTEQACMAVSGVLSAIGVGQMKANLGLLVELNRDLHMRGSECKKNDVMQNLLKALDAANANRQTYERVILSRIVVATSEQPLPRSAKGLVQRKSAVEMYKDEIEACFAI